MNQIDCQNVQNNLDSLIDKNLSEQIKERMDSHLKTCAECRNEMAARDNLRQVLQTAVKSTTASPEFQIRLSNKLRREAGIETSPNSTNQNWLASFVNFFLKPQLVLATTACLLICLTGIYFLTNSKSAYAAELSPALWDQAAGDHDHCTAQWLNSHQPEDEPVIEAEKYDESLKYLTRYTGNKSFGYVFHSAHVCHQGERKFIHFVYTKDHQPFSVFITDRNSVALKSGKVPADDGVKAGFQNVTGIRNKYDIGGYQTSRHIILVVSTMTPDQNFEIAEKLAKPISQYLRSIDK